MPKKSGKSLFERAAVFIGIKPKSVARRVQRAAKKGELPKLENVPAKLKTKIRKVAKAKIVKKSVAPVEPVSAARPEIRYPRTIDTEISIAVPDAANPLANESAAGKKMVLVSAEFLISNDWESRKPLRLFADPETIQRIINAGSLYDALAIFADSEDNDFFSGIGEFKGMEII